MHVCCLVCVGRGEKFSSLWKLTLAKIVFTCFADCLVLFLLASNFVLIVAFLALIVLLCTIKAVQEGFAVLWTTLPQFAHQKLILAMCFKGQSS